MRTFLLLAVLMLPFAARAVTGPAHAEAGGRAGERTLTVANHARQSITALRVSNAHDDDWGEDRLGGDQTIAPGRSYTVHLQGHDCTWDVQATYHDGRTEEQRGIDVCHARTLAFDGSRAQGGEGGQDEGAQEAHDASVRNGTDHTITEVYVSPRTATDWGTDRLGDDQLPSGKAISFVFNGGCKQDVRIVYDNKSAEERRGVDLCAHPRLRITAGWALSDDLGNPAPDTDQGSGEGEHHASPDHQSPDQTPGDQGPGDHGPDEPAPDTRGGEHIGVVLPQGSLLRLAH